MNEYTDRNSPDNVMGELCFPDGSRCSRDPRVTGRNNNIAVIGPSGAGKSEVMCSLNIMSANSSFVISDPKGGLYRKFRSVLPAMGYKVKKLDLTHPENSAGYNPLAYVKDSGDALKLAHAIVNNAYTDGSMTDPFWPQNAEALLTSMILYLLETGAKDGKLTLAEVLDMLRRMAATEDFDERDDLDVYRDFIAHGKEDPSGEAYRHFRPFINLSGKTLSCVITTLSGTLTPFDSKKTREMLRRCDFDFTDLAKERTAIFVIVSDTDRSCDLIANLFYMQAMNVLCDYADTECGGKLRVPVSFMLDDFATNCRVEGFENIISNIRARNISAMIMLQSFYQLEAGYGKAAHTILNNCDTVVFMGANSLSDAEYFAKRANKPVQEILEMPLFSSYIFRRSEKPRFVRNINPDEWWWDTLKQMISEREQAGAAKS